MGKGFEGYYVKCVDSSFAVAVIFGRNNGKGDKSSFVQVITKERSYWFGFEYSECMMSRKNFVVSIGKSKENRVCRKGMVLDLDDGQVQIKCELTFGEFTPIKYDAMGPFKFLPFMECRHRVESMNHRVSGNFEIRDSAIQGQSNGRQDAAPTREDEEKFIKRSGLSEKIEHSFSDADGYIEGDRGKSFPRKYFWSQSNSFKEFPNLSVAAMCARIPYFGIRFRGTINFVYFEGREYRLATYLGARVKVFKKERLVIVQGFGRRKKRLEVVGSNIEQNMKELYAPAKGSMSRIIKESIIANVSYKFSIGKRILFDTSCENSAIEFGDR